MSNESRPKEPQQTCPEINRAIKDFRLSCNQLFDEFETFAESMREQNQNLRNWGNSLIDKIEELESEIIELDDEIIDLRDRLIEKEKKNENVRAD